jgi:exopolysaccharide production protein ExoQ
MTPRLPARNSRHAAVAAPVIRAEASRRLPIHGAIRRRPVANRYRRPWFSFDSDGFFAFALAAAMLFAWSLGTAGAAAVAALTLIYAMVRLPQIGEVLAPRAFILIAPILAILSVLWSQYPTETLKYSLEFALTVGSALLLSAAPRPTAVLWGLFFAFACYVAVSLVLGQAVDVGNTGETAFAGLTESKNLLGDIASTGALLSLACFVASIEDRRPFRALLTIVVGAIEVYAMIEARSAGALLGIAPAVASFIFFLALRPARFVVRLLVTMLASLLAAVGTIGLGSTVLETGMTLFDKDPTLTGRTYLWQRAADFIAEKPILGDGFNGFWVQGNTDAEGLWRYAGIIERMGFSFHNSLIEILVNLGWVGVVVFGSVAIVGSVVLLRRVMTRPTLALCFWMSFVVYELVRTPIEAIGTAPFSHSTLLLFTGLGAGFTARRLAVIPARFRRPARLRLGALRPAPAMRRAAWGSERVSF